MDERKPSRTATIAAINRAAHLFLDGEPKILRDELALGLSGMPNEEEIRALLSRVESEISQQFGPEIGKAMWPGYRGLVLARNRYTEDELETAIRNGVSQYVILGAGLDSFAYRRRDLENVLNVFEVDYPTTQQWKKSRIQELGVSFPTNLTFIPLDLEKHTLSEVLRIGGYRADLPAFFSLLGVTQYLTEKAIFEILQEVVRGAPGTGIVFEYVLIDSLLTEKNKKIVDIHKRNSVNSGETWLSQFNPIDLANRVKQLGFLSVSDFGSEEAKDAYFTGRTDLLAEPRGSGVFEYVHLMKAQVGGSQFEETKKKSDPTRA